MKNKLNILLIDDDYKMARSFSRELCKLVREHHLYVTGRGAEGLALMTAGQNGERIKFDLIIVNLSTSDGSGLEFLKVIKGYYSFSSIKTFVLINSSDDRKKVTASNLDVDGYLIKPLSIAQFELYPSVVTLHKLLMEE